MEFPAGERPELEAGSSYRDEDGTLYLTNHRLIFYSHKSKRQLVVMRDQVRDHKLNRKDPMIKLIAEIKGASRDLLFTFTSPVVEQATASRDNFSRALTAIQIGNAAIKSASLPQVKLEPGLQSSSTGMTPLAAAGPDSERKRPLAHGASGPRRILPSTGPQPPPKVLEVRAKLLARDRELKLLHTSLVEGGVVSEEEFWEARKLMLQQESQRIENQSRGISSAVAEVQRSQESNTITYRLDAARMHAIFVESPTVHRAYQAMVPIKMNEKDFWTKYFASQYFHRNRQDAGNEPANVMFASFETKEDTREDKYARTKVASIDPSVDLRAADTRDDVESDRISVLASDDVDASRPGHSRRLELLRKYNRHAQMILSSARAPHGAGVATAAALATGFDPNQEKARHAQYHRDLSESLTFLDLENEPVTSYHELKIQDGRTLFARVHAGTSTSSSSISNGNGSTSSSSPPPMTQTSVVKVEVDRDVTCAFTASVAQWMAPSFYRDHTVFPSPSLCSRLLAELSNNARGMDRARTTALASSSSQETQRMVFSVSDEKDMEIPAAFQDVIKNHAATCRELFRHFWCCFPVTPSSQNKMKRVRDSLLFQYEELEKTKHELHNAGQSSLVPLLRPLLNSADLVFAAYDDHEKKDAARMAQRAKMMQSAPNANPAANNGALKRPAPAAAVTAPITSAAASNGDKRPRVAS